MEQAVNAAGAAETPNEPTEQAQEPSAFDSLAEKKGFKSVDDLVKAYQNLEGQTTKTSQELREIRKAITQQNEPQPEDPLKDLPAEQKQALGLLEGLIERTLDKRLQPIQQDIETRRAGDQISAIKQQYPDLTDSHVERALDYMETNRNVPFGDAVKIVSYDDVRSSSQTQQAQTAKANEKNRAFVESGRTSRTGDNIDYSKLSLEELENILPKSKNTETFKKADGTFVRT